MVTVRAAVYTKVLVCAVASRHLWWLQLQTHALAATVVLTLHDVAARAHPACAAGTVAGTRVTLAVARARGPPARTLARLAELPSIAVEATVACAVGAGALVVTQGITLRSTVAGVADALKCCIVLLAMYTPATMEGQKYITRNGPFGSPHYYSFEFYSIML